MDTNLVEVVTSSLSPEQIERSASAINPTADRTSMLDRLLGRDVVAHHAGISRAWGGALLGIASVAGIFAFGVFVIARRVRTPELPTITGVNIPTKKLHAPKLPPITAPAMPAIPATPEPAVRNPIDEAIMNDSSLPTKLPVGTITFPFGSATPTAESMAAIDALAASLEAHDGARVRLDGYTDTTGDDDVNRPLSWQRADAVRKLLQDRGVGAEHMMAIGHSERAPIANNATAPGRAENRRVEVTLVAR